MSLLSAFQVAFGALFAHKGRTALTSLGIVIGISAVIAMVSAGDGARHKLDERLESVGKTMVLLRAGVRTDQGAIADFAPLTAGDADAIRKRLGERTTGVAEVQMAQRLAITRWGRWPAMVVGSTPEVQRIRNWQVAAGRFYSDADVRAGAAVCLIGETVRQKLFPDVPSAVGQTITLGGVPFRVVGVAVSKGRSATGADQDDQIFVPLTALQKKLAGEARVNLILCGARGEADLPSVRDDIKALMRTRHKLKPDQPADFDVSSVQELAELAVVVTATMQALSAVIASVSLLVGGIGIMNIMLVSVTERTKEIGVRLALGATGYDVLRQFLLEAVVLSIGGGLTGVAFGIGMAWLLATGAGWPLVVRPLAVGIAFAVSAGVGLFFGFYPAWRAAGLDPIEALRHE